MTGSPQRQILRWGATRARRRRLNVPFTSYPACGIASPTSSLSTKIRFLRRLPLMHVIRCLWDQWPDLPMKTDPAT